jgi:enoyl-[acyl-carrier-protein] reductase (NADH)
MFTDGTLTPLSEVVGNVPAEQELESLERATMLARLPTLADAGSTAVFLASDHARAITAAAINLTSGAVAD